MPAEKQVEISERLGNQKGEQIEKKESLQVTEMFTKDNCDDDTPFDTPKLNDHRHQTQDHLPNLQQLKEDLLSGKSVKKQKSSLRNIRKLTNRGKTQKQFLKKKLESRSFSYASLSKKTLKEDETEKQDESEKLSISSSVKQPYMPKKITQAAPFDYSVTPTRSKESGRV